MNKPHSKPTIREVADACGVAISSVSKALNMDPDKCTLKEETRKRIIEVAKNLGFQPNWRARSLASKQTQTIALV